MEQVMILLASGLSIWLIQDPRRSFKQSACVLGLLAQPFWFYATFISGQWGMFLLNFCFTISWLKGAYINFFVKDD